MADRLVVSSAAGLRHVVVAVAGDLDAVTAREFEDQLMQQVPDRSRRVVVDLSELRFMDTSAIHVLVRANNRVMAADGLLVLAGAQPEVARVLALAGADEVMPVTGSVAEALTWPE